MEYKDKNKSFNTKGNEAIDRLICINEANAIISDSLKNRINNLALWILTNHERYTDDLRSEIKRLDDDLRWTIILTDRYISLVIQSLTDGLEFEINRKK